MSSFNTPEEKEKRKELVSKLREFIENVKDLPHKNEDNWLETLSSECRKSEKAFDDYREFRERSEQKGN